MRIIATAGNIWLPDFQILITSQESTDLSEKFDAFQVKHSKHLKYALKKGQLKQVTGAAGPLVPPPVPKGDAWL